MDREQQAADELEIRMKKEKDRRMFERYQAVYLYLQGKTMKEIAEILRRNEKTVSQYIRSYQAKGLDGLQMEHSPGAPTRLTPEQQEQFKRIVVEQFRMTLDSLRNSTGPCT